MHSRRERGYTRFPIVVGEHGWGGCAPHLKIFFESPAPTKTNAPLWSTPHPLLIINEAPPSEKQTAPIET